MNANLAPMLTLAALVYLGVFGVGDTTKAVPTDVYFSEVQREVEGLPYSIGRWVGQDVDVTPSAIKLLRPNAVLQRRYVDPLTNEYFNLLVVHCGDTRDMLGHYPPVCYPAHGWRMESKEPAQIERSRGKNFQGTGYVFERGSGTNLARMLCVHFFVIPDRETPCVGTRDRLERVSHFAGMAQLGAGQVQILVPGESSPEFQAEVIADVLKALDPIISVVSSGPQS